MFSLVKPILGVIGLAFLVAGLAISGYSIYTNTGETEQQALFNAIEENPVTGTTQAFIFTFTYMSLTPAITYEWFGNPERQTWLLEQFPLWDKFDIFALALFWLIAVPIASMIFHIKDVALGWRLLWILLLFTAGTALFWILWKTILYFLMHWSGNAIGIESETIETLRATETALVEENIGWSDYITLTIILTGAFLISFFGGGRSRKEKG